LCDHDVTTNFGIVVGKVILVDSCAVIVIYLVKKKTKKKQKQYCGGTVQFKFHDVMKYS